MRMPILILMFILTPIPAAAIATAATTTASTDAAVRGHLGSIQLCQSHIARASLVFKGFLVTLPVPHSHFRC